MGRRVSFSCRSFTEDQVEKLFHRCCKIMANKGYPVPDISFSLSRRMKHCHLGSAHHLTRRIKLNYHFYITEQTRSVLSRINVMLHEMCHIAADDIIIEENQDKPWSKRYCEKAHGPVFRLIRRKVLGVNKEKLS